MRRRACLRKKPSNFGKWPYCKLARFVRPGQGSIRVRVPLAVKGPASGKVPGFLTRAKAMSVEPVLFVMVSLISPPGPTKALLSVRNS